MDFIKETQAIKREGLDNLMVYLEQSDFFTAPASSKYHGNHAGGLASHSMYVHDVMRELLSILPIEGIDMESVHICGLLHDVCKIDYYELDQEEATSAQMRKFQELSDIALPKGTKTKAHLIKVIDALLRKEPIPEFKPSYKIVDKLPMGHGEKSVYIIQKFMRLTNEEAIAIRWHLGGFDPAAYNSQMGNPSMQAFKEYKLLPLLAGADIIASYLLDAW